MPRRLRYVPPGHPVEITQRTFQGRFLLKPSPEMNRVVKGVLGRAVRKYRMVLHAFTFLSNHYHLIITPRDAHHQAAFLCYLNGNLAREIRHLCDWPQRIWGRRYSSIPITRQRRAQIERLRYVLAQGVKEGLVAKALDWPGASGLAQMLDPTAEIVGIWYDRSKAYRMRLAGLEVRPEDWTVEERIQLTPLPVLSRLSLNRQIALVRRLVFEIEREAKLARGEGVLGAEAITAQHPHDAPQTLKRSLTPLVHAGSLAAWRAFKETYRAFVAAYCVARNRLRAGAKDVVFPEGSFPSPMPFVRAAPA
jgi:REP element-mobilizing transposase RayT